MAKDKKSFVLYADLIHTVKKMNREDAGELLLHILKYVNDENPETENMAVYLTFEPIKQQFKRDLKKWEMAPSNPAAFEKAGIKFCFTSSDLKDVKSFMAQIRKAISYGLSE